MKFAFVIFKYFPFGGAQRDMMRIAQRCVQRGHEVHIYTLSWEGPPATEGITAHVLPGRGWPNFRRYRNFIDDVHAYIADAEFDLVLGFNRLPGLDAYFAADPCFVERAQARWGRFYRLSARYRFFSDCERAVFGAGVNTQILMISPAEKAHFQRWHGTPEARFHLVPPFLSPERFQLQDVAETRVSVRHEFGFDASDNVLLLVGSGFKTKGLDRVLQGLAVLPDALRKSTRLLVVGQDNPKAHLAMATRLGLASQVVISPGRNDVPRLMQAADVLVHPAYSENTGLVLLEAGACGLPVLASAVCGYAFHIRESGAGQLTPQPFEQLTFSRQLQEMLTSSERHVWSERGKAYAAKLMRDNDGSAEAMMLEQFARAKAGRH